MNEEREFSIGSIRASPVMAPSIKGEGNHKFPRVKEDLGVKEISFSGICEHLSL